MLPSAEGGLVKYQMAGERRLQTYHADGNKSTKPARKYFILLYQYIMVVLFFIRPVQNKNTFYVLTYNMFEKINYSQVVMGGGRREFLPQSINGGKRNDGRNLIKVSWNLTSSFIK